VARAHDGSRGIVVKTIGSVFDQQRGELHGLETHTTLGSHAFHQYLQAVESKLNRRAEGASFVRSSKFAVRSFEMSSKSVALYAFPATATIAGRRTSSPMR
jgi:hypothetical protein